MYLVLIKENLMLDKVRVNNTFNFAIPGPFHLFLSASLGLETWQNFLDNQI